MKIGDAYFDLPLYMVTTESGIACVGNDAGSFLILYTERLFAERALRPGHAIVEIASLEQLRQTMAFIELPDLVGVCFDVERQPDGLTSKFAFDWSSFKTAIQQDE